MGYAMYVHLGDFFTNASGHQTLNDSNLILTKIVFP
jgi:hypothetical protein